MKYSSFELPIGWSRKMLGEFARTYSGGTPSRGKANYFGGNIPWIRSGELNQQFVYETEGTLTKEGFDNSSAKMVSPGTLLLAIYGATAGVPGITHIEAAINQAILAIVPNKEADAMFLFHWLTLNRQQIINEYQQGAQPNLSAEIVKSLLVALPPAEQQRKINEAIAVWDEAISLQTRQLQQLQRRANALRQDLLLEKRRLNGFSKQWQEVKIGALVKEVKRPVVWNDDEEYALISMRRRSGGAFLRERLFGHQILTKNLRTARVGDFLISKMQVVHGASGLVPAELDGMKVSGSYVALVSRNSTTFDINFLDCLSKLSWFYHLCYVCSYGVHIEKMTFDLSDFLNQTIKVPEIAEQRVIAEILNTAEAEIRLNERKLEALREQKRGLLQQLLTGEILLS